MRCLLIAGAAMLGAGCFGIYGEISDLEDSTVVNESGRPDDVASDDYAIEIVFGGSGGDGVKVTVLGSSPSGVVNLRYDQAGELSSSGVQLGTDFNNISPGVATAGFPARFESNDSIALGLPLADGGARIALFDADSSQIDTKQFRVDDVPSGLAIGVTNTSGDTNLDQPDIVAVGDTELVMFANYPAADPQPDPAATFRCGLPAPALEAFAGDIFAQAVDGDEVAIAVDGVVRIVRGSTIEAQSGAMAGCFDGVAPFDIAAPMGEADFGDSMAVADLDGSGLPDLVVTAPAANRVYVFFDLEEGQTPASAVIDGAGAFGAAIAVGDFDGDNTAELAIGAPGATVDGIGGAGQIHLYDVAGGAATEAAVLALADAEAQGAFGRALAVGQFDDVDDLLVAGARDKVFVYFQHPLPGDSDPRVR